MIVWILSGTRRETQYFEMIGNRGIYHQGWFANTTPVAPPWNGMAPRPTDVLNGFPWELYNLADDPTQYQSVAGQNRCCRSMPRRWTGS
jgi:arylsulfatase A-like enzyme